MAETAGGGGGLGGGVGGTGDTDIGTYIPPDGESPAHTQQNMAHYASDPMHLSQMLMAMLLSIFKAQSPPPTPQQELAIHGFKTQQGTPQELLQSQNTQRLAIRPTSVPYA
jgi:hypothetical protein